jgi:hypothetical protein
VPRKLLHLVLAFIVVLGAIGRGQTSTVDWKSQRAEILQHFRALVQIDTANPEGLWF